MFNTFYGNKGVDAAHYASSVLGADIISLSWYYSCSPTASWLLQEKEILDNGTTIIRAAGNGNNNCGGNRVYPFSGLEDERTIVVSSTGKDDKHANTFQTCTTNTSNSHYAEVDLCAPGYEIMGGTSTNGGQNTWPYYGCYYGTSQSTPLVSGTAALMYAVNPCLTQERVQDILKNSTDPILDESNYSGLVGTGRLNAFKAVKGAQESYSNSLDLFIKDRDEDFGNEQYPYHWQADRDESVDIWVRNQPDGFSNFEHQEPEFQNSSPVYVYVRVRNKSCSDASGSEQLSLYWSKSSGWSSWPQNWDGSQSTIGNKIGTVSIGTLEAGQEDIYEFTWNILNPYIHQNWGSCLLARIENSSVDPITVHPGRLDDDVFYNNNIAMRNVVITDIIPGVPPPGEIGGLYYPHGKYVFAGNVLSDIQEIDIVFTMSENETLKSLNDEAEVRLLFDDNGWLIVKDALEGNSSFEILRDKEVLLLAENARIDGVEFPPNTRIPIYIGFTFLVEKISGNQSFDFHFRQYLTSSDELLGGVHFDINRYNRTPFDADAGLDRVILSGESVSLSAVPINESATYNWYDQEGNFVFEGVGFSISPVISQKYKLEVISDVDGFKDYDEVQVEVNPYWIESLSPNPATSNVQIDYAIQGASSAYLMILNQTSTVFN